MLNVTHEPRRAHGRGPAERLLLAGLALAAAALLAAGVASEAQVHPRDIEIPELGEIRLPEAKRVELGNGVVVHLLEDREFPMVEVRVVTRGGAVYDPPDRIGLARVMAQVMRAGGTERHPGDALDERIESIGTELDVSAGESEITASLSTLTEHLDEGLDILADVLRNPAFPEEKLEEIRKQENTAIAARNDEPIGILQREFSKLVYGADSPYGWHSEYATIGAITTDDLRGAHARLIQPARTFIVAWGDFSAKDMQKKIGSRFGDWPAGKTKLDAPPGLPGPSDGGLFYAKKTDVTNATVAVGGIGIQRDDPMYPAAMVLQEALGGGFGSRLFNEIRTKRGLAYATGCFIQAPLHRKGTAAGYVITQADSAVATIGYLLGEIERARTEPMDPDEVRRARDALLNSFVFQFDSPGEVVLRQARFEAYGYPADFLERYQEGVRRVTAGDVQAAASAIFQPDSWKIIVIGNQEDFAEPLAKLGAVTDLDIAIPDPPISETIPDATPAALARGQEIVAKMIDAYGGADAIGGIRDVAMAGSGNVSMQGMDIQVEFKNVFALPDRMLSEQRVFGQVVRQIVTGETGWMKSPQGESELTEEQIRKMWGNRIADGGIFFLTRAPEMEIQSLGTREVDGRELEVIHVRDFADLGILIFVDPKTHRVVRSSFRTDHPMTQAPVTQATVYGEFAEAGGVPFPRALDVTLDGDPFLSAKVSDVTVNAGLDASVFEKPAP